MRRRITELVQHEAFVAGAVDAHGNLVESWAPPVEVGVYAFNPGVPADSLEAGHDRDTSTPSIYVPSAVTMAARDRVTVRGLLYEVDGETQVYRNPYGARMDGNQINLRKVAG